jgi:hypothetical protein
MRAAKINKNIINSFSKCGWQDFVYFLIKNTSHSATGVSESYYRCLRCNKMFIGY